MFGSKFNTGKCETTCRLCVGRIKLIRNKKTVLLKQSQKDIAELLRNGKQEYARIRVEGVIREKYLLQAYEILELYLELLTVRTQLIAKTKELPRDMMEAVSSIIYAAQRLNDLPELSTLRALFASKYGKEYAAEAASDATASRWQVNANLIRCLLVEAPQPEEKLAMLSEIAQDHGVEWDLAAAARDMGVGGPGAGVVPPIPTPLGPELAAVGSPGAYPGQPAAHGVALPAAAAGVPLGHHPASAAHAQYATAQQAAMAAAQAAAQAHAAAQFAAQAAAMAPPPGHQPGGGGAQAWFPQVPPAGNGDMAQYGAAAAGPPPQPGHPPLPPGTGTGAAFVRSAPSAAAPTDDGPAPGAPLNGGGVGGGGGGFLVRSNSDIQRDYDAAPGPPVKGASAVPPPAPAPAPMPPAAPILPSPPHHTEGKAAPSAPPPPPQVEDEYEELTRRLEALKKS